MDIIETPTFHIMWFAEVDSSLLVGSGVEDEPPHGNLELGGSIFVAPLQDSLPNTHLHMQMPLGSARQLVIIQSGKSESPPSHRSHNLREKFPLDLVREMEN